MGLYMANLLMLSEEGFFKHSNTRILDIGSQNLYYASPDDIRKFVEVHGRPIVDKVEFQKEAERISYFSWPRPGERTSYISELLDLTDFFYTSYDVCPALKTEIFDLNQESLPKYYKEQFDLVLNFGTTEHILNQLNCFKLMHDALNVNGLIFHQLPSIGWVDHGYFTYHPKFFLDIANSNALKIHSMFYTFAGQTNLSKSIQGDIRDPTMPGVVNKNHAEITLPNYNLNVLLVKTESREFRLPLELETSHAQIDEKINKKYMREPETANA